MDENNPYEYSSGNYSSEPSPISNPYDSANYSFSNDNVYDNNPLNNAQSEPPLMDEDPQKEEKKKRRPWIIILLLLLLAGLGIGGVWTLQSKEQMHAQYEEYIRQNRDSVALVLANLNAQIDSLEGEKSQLMGIIRDKDNTISERNSRIKRLLANYDPVKYKKALENVKELKAYVQNLEDEVKTLQEENAKLAAQNKVLSAQVDTLTRKYDDLYQAYMTCCGKDSAQAKSKTGEDNNAAFQISNVSLSFVAFDKKGEPIPTDANNKKLKLSDIKRFDINFDALADKNGPHTFYVRITDSVQGNIVVPSDYSEAGKKVLKLASGEEVPYTYSINYDYTTPNTSETVESNFLPYSKQIRYLPYRIEIYDYSGKLAEGYARPPTSKGAKQKAKWIW